MIGGTRFLLIGLLASLACPTGWAFEFQRPDTAEGPAARDVESAAADRPMPVDLPRGAYKGNAPVRAGGQLPADPGVVAPGSGTSMVVERDRGGAVPTNNAPASARADDGEGLIVQINPGNGGAPIPGGTLNRMPAAPVAEGSIQLLPIPPRGQQAGASVQTLPVPPQGRQVGAPAQIVPVPPRGRQDGLDVTVRYQPGFAPEQRQLFKPLPVGLTYNNPIAINLMDRLMMVRTPGNDAYGPVQRRPGMVDR